MKKETIDTSVVKSNLLVESRYKLSLNELKLLLWMIREIDINDKDWQKYKIYIKQFMDTSGINRSKFYSEAKIITKKFLSKVLELKTKTGFIQTHFMSSIEYIDGEAFILYDFHPDLKEHLLRLKSSFLRYDIANIIDCKSVYSIRIYQLLKAFEQLKSRTITVKDLRYMLVVEDEYKRFYDFRRFILDKSKKDLKKHSDLFFEYETHKQGRNIHSITFHVKKQKQRRLFDNKEDYIKNDEIIALEKASEKKLKELEEAGKDAVPMPIELKNRL
jgi:plasmid replication initiation protein